MLLTGAVLVLPSFSLSPPRLLSAWRVCFETVGCCLTPPRRRRRRRRRRSARQAEKEKEDPSGYVPTAFDYEALPIVDQEGSCLRLRKFFASFNFAYKYTKSIVLHGGFIYIALYIGFALLGFKVRASTAAARACLAQPPCFAPNKRPATLSRPAEGNPHHAPPRGLACCEQRRAARRR